MSNKREISDIVGELLDALTSEDLPQFGSVVSGLSYVDVYGVIYSLGTLLLQRNATNAQGIGGDGKQKVNADKVISELLAAADKKHYSGAMRAILENLMAEEMRSVIYALVMQLRAQHIKHQQVEKEVKLLITDAGDIAEKVLKHGSNLEWLLKSIAETGNEG